MDISVRKAATFIGLYVLTFVGASAFLHLAIFIPGLIAVGYTNTFNFLRDEGPLSSTGFLVFMAFVVLVPTVSTYQSWIQRRTGEIESSDAAEKTEKARLDGLLEKFDALHGELGQILACQARIQEYQEEISQAISRIERRLETKKS